MTFPHGSEAHGNAPLPNVVLAIDPGSVKCGLAVVCRGTTPGEPVTVLHREIADRARVVARALPLISEYQVEMLLIGDATGGASLARALQEALPASVPLLRVNEAFTSQRARQRFLHENPPRGLQRLLPPGFRTPPCPIDDYVAVLLAEDFFGEK